MNGLEAEHLVNNPLERIRAVEIALQELQANAVTSVEQVGGVTDHGSLTGLGDDDHTQYSLVDGTRAFTGTVGGVTPAAASDLATKGYVDTTTGDHGSLTGLGDDDHAQYMHIDNARTITAQHSFSPGSAQAPFVLGANAQSQLVTGLRADELDRQVIAGNGLDTGGTLTSDVTLNVDLHSTWSGLEFDGGELRVDLDAEFAWTGTHTFQGDVQIDGNLEFIGPHSITTTSGDLTIAPAGDLLLDPGGQQVKFANWNSGDAIESSDYVSQTTGWAISYGASGGHADFRSMYADELHVLAFTADIYSAMAGAIILTKSRARLSRNFTIPNTSASATLYVEDLEGLPDTQVFDANDYVLLRAVDTSGGGMIITDVFGQVTSYSDLAGGEQSWTFTTTTTAYSAGDTVYTGSIVLDYGQTGVGEVRGVWEVTVLDAAGSPYSQVQSWDTIASGEPSNFTTHVRIGNLDGLSGIGLEYGLWAGQGTDPEDAYILVSDQSAEFHNIALELYDGTDLRIAADPTATGTGAMLWAGPSATDKRFIVQGDGDVWLSTLAISSEMGQMFFSTADGLMLYGPGCKLVPTGASTFEWTSTRGQVASGTGAFHTESGRWAGTRGVVVEEGTTNLFTNPSFEIGLAGWTGNGTNYDAQSSAEFRFGNHSSRISGYAQIVYYHESITVSATTYTLSCYIKPDNGSISGFSAWFDSSTQAWDSTTDVGNGWFRCVHTGTATAGARTFGLRVTSTGPDFYCDGFQLEEKGCPTTYCDGSLGGGYSWSGTAHGSTSTRTATEINVDTYADLLDGNDTWSIAMWVQAPYDADATWAVNTPVVFGVYYDASNVARLLYDPVTSDIFYLHVNGSNLTTGASTETFNASDWIHVVATFDFASDEYKVYVDGALGVSDTTAFTAPAGVNQMNICTQYDAANHWGGQVAEVALFDRVLDAAEVATLYARTRPLVDAGAATKPGIYIIDGAFSLATSTSGARIEFDESGFWMYDADGDEAFGISLEDSKSWAGFTIDAGDVVLGDNVAGSSAIKWDQSAGKFGFYGNASATVQVEIDTDGSLVAGAGSVILNSTGMQLVCPSSPGAGLIQWLDSGDNKRGYISQYYDTSLYVNKVLWSLDDYAELGGSWKAVHHLRTDCLYLTTTDVAASTDPGKSFLLRVTGDGRIDNDLRVGAGLYVGSNVDPDPDDIHYDGNLKSVKSATTYDVYAFYPLTTPLTHTSFDGDSFSDVGTSTVIENTSWSSTIPADAKALLIRIGVQDSATWGTAGLYFGLGPSASYWNAAVVYPAGGDVPTSIMAVVPCTNGDVYYQCNASGTNTLDVWLVCWGYWI